MSEWTKADRFAPDRNPLVDCADDRCDEQARWLDMADAGWQKPSNPTEPVLCPDCRGDRPTDFDRRRWENQQLPQRGDEE